MDRRPYCNRGKLKEVLQSLKVKYVVFERIPDKVFFQPTFFSVFFAFRANSANIRQQQKEKTEASFICEPNKGRADRGL